MTTSFDDHDMNAVGNMPVIFLVGMRGSGKTTLGRALADKLGWLFADTDEMLCARCGRTVSEIVQEEAGEGFAKGKRLCFMTWPGRILSSQPEAG